MSKPAEPDELEEKWDAKAQERAESKDQKNGLKLPSIQLRKYVNCFEKENDVKMEESIYKVEGKKLNLESFNEAKIRIAETAKAEGFDALKYINIRPLRIEQSPSKKRDLSTKLVMKNKGKGKV